MAKKIYVSPSDQDGNLYAVGNTNEMAQCQKNIRGTGCSSETLRL
jgi:hypothetical protein